MADLGDDLRKTQLSVTVYELYAAIGKVLTVPGPGFAPVHVVFDNTFLTLPGAAKTVGETENGGEMVCLWRGFRNCGPGPDPLLEGVSELRPRSRPPAPMTSTELCAGHPMMKCVSCASPAKNSKPTAKGADRWGWRCQSSPIPARSLLHRAMFIRAGSA